MSGTNSGKDDVEDSGKTPASAGSGSDSGSDSAGSSAGNSNPLAYEAPAYTTSDARAASASPTEQQLEHETPGGVLEEPEHDPYAAWHYRGFRLVSIGWIVSLLGNQMTSAAILYELYYYAKNANPLAWLGLVGALPVMVLVLPAGAIADRFNRASIILWGNVINCLAYVGLAVISWHLGHLKVVGNQYIWLLLPPLITNICFTFTRAARAALLPQLVPATVFGNAVTWNSTIFETSGMAGSALGGLLLYFSFRLTHCASLIYVINVGCSIVYVIVLGIIAREYPGRHTASKTDRRLLQGLEFVWKEKVVLGAITLDLFAVLLGGATYLLPIFAKRLGVHEIGYGLLRAAPALGAILMAMVLAHLPPMKKAGRNLLWAVAGFGAATIVFGISRSFVLSMCMLFLTGMFDNISVVVRHTLVQVVTPDSMRGRVSAVNNVFIGASNDLGGWESGKTTFWFGPLASVVGGGIGTIVVVTLISLFFPHLRRFGSLQEAAEKTSDADAQAQAAANAENHLCGNCGYSLRDNTSGICPECGAPTAAPAVIVK